MKSWFRSEERLFRLEDEGLDQTADNQTRRPPFDPPAWRSAQSPILRRMRKFRLACSLSLLPRDKKQIIQHVHDT
jgi:hypothetical protein